MKRFFSFLLLVVLLILPAACCEEANLIKNGDFSKVNSGFPEDWDRGMWLTDAGVSTLFIDEGPDGNCAVVVNADANDARWEQKINVEPDTVYRFSAKVRAEGCGAECYGATISFSGTFSYSESLTDTNGEWKEVVVYGRTGKKQKELTVMLRVGGYSNLNTGRAWFDDVECVKAENVPEGVDILSLEEQKSSGQKASAAPVSDEEPQRNTEAYLLLTVLYGIAILALVRRSHRLGGKETCGSGNRVAVIGLLIAAIIRIVMAVCVRGYNTDINCFSAWSERMFAVGPGNFYAADYFCDYPPGYMLVLWLPAALRSLFGADVQSGLHLILLKAVPIICDLAGAQLIYRYAKKNDMHPLLAAGFALVYAFNPAVIIDSAAWGQIDSVFTLFVILCAVRASEGNYISSLVSFAAAMLIKPQAMLFAPLGLFVIIVDLIRSKNRKQMVRFAAGVAAALGVLYATGMIFGSGADPEINILFRPVVWLYNLYGSTLGSYAYVTINALNLYQLAELNWASMESNHAWALFAWIMFAFSYVYSMFLCVRSGNRKHIFLSGAVLITLIFTFGPMIHERYIYPAILLLMLAYVCDHDKRLLIAVTIMTCTTAMNEILVLQGGMGTGNYGHLQSSEQWLNAALAALNVVNAFFLMWTAADICGIFTGEHHIIPLKPCSGEVRVVEIRDHRLGLKRVEVLFMVAVTLVYSAAAFTNLGVTKAPQTNWVSSQSGESVVFDLGEVKEHRMLYYGGICNSTFSVELSNDGEAWTRAYTARYDQGEIFRWLYYIPCDPDMNVEYGTYIEPTGSEASVRFATGEEPHPFQKARYIRITAQSAGLTLSEFGFRAPDDELLMVSSVVSAGGLEGFETDPQALVDEQDTVPVAPSYLNSTYFDEIYHARTAYELLHGMNVYEWTHPPLGKVLMMAGISLFGMTPFGWRFMGTLVGVLMLPVMYLLVKQLTGSKKLSGIAMLLLALDSMHFTQTRIATIDSYAVFWIMVEYLFMFRYVQMDWKQVPLGKTLVTLGLCGITMGISWATKWIGIYAAAGLAVMFFWKIGSEYSGSPEMRSAYGKRIIKTVLFCIVFFVIIPLMIYYLSYYRQLRYEGVTTIADMFKAKSFNRVVDLQQSMFSYHSGLGGDTHYFRSPWYQWPIIWWPMWYYSGTEYMPQGMISSISCMGNPAVWWFGLAALIFILVMAAYKRRAPKAWLLVLLGFASQFLPWVLVPRSTFIYHYFASVPFIIICSVLVLGEVRRHDPKVFRIAAGTLLILALVLFIAFYPLESGMPVARSYAKYLRWFEWYNF